MRLLVALTCLLAGYLAQKPRPCSSPPLMSGAFTLTTQDEKLYTYALYLYDALGQRMRFWEQGTYENKSFVQDVLLNFREGALYDIIDSNRTCTKKPLKGDFQPLAIPKDATLLAQVVLGSSSGPGQGLLVNTWIGDLPKKAGKFLSTVTEFGCIPVTTLYQTEQFGWTVISFFDNLIGIADPSLLNPPDFCSNAKTEEEPLDFLSLFHQTH